MGHIEAQGPAGRYVDVAVPRNGPSSPYGAGRAPIPRVAVIICTRNRPTTLVRAVRSVLASEPRPAELWIVDQSDRDDSHRMISQYLDDPGIRYLPVRGSGLSMARNSALELSSCEIAAYTDDDCELHQDFISAVAAAFEVDSRIAIVYGNVLPAPHSPATGFIPHRIHDGERMIRTVGGASGGGMGACMSVRREAWATLGGFDERLGAGTPLRAAEEFDLTIRALLGGFYVFETDAVTVVHHGVRPWSAQEAVIQSYYHGTGAALAKHLRCSPAPVSSMAARRALPWLFAKPPIDIGHPLNRGARLTALLCGAVAGLRMPVDRQTMMFLA